GCNGTCGWCDENLDCTPAGACCASRWSYPFAGAGQTIAPRSSGGAIAGAQTSEVNVVGCAGLLDSTLTPGVGQPTFVAEDAQGHVFGVATQIVGTDHVRSFFQYTGGALGV